MPPFWRVPLYFLKRVPPPRNSFRVMLSTPPRKIDHRSQLPTKIRSLKIRLAILQKTLTPEHQENCHEEACPRWKQAPLHQPPREHRAERPDHGAVRHLLRRRPNNSRRRSSSSSSSPGIAKGDKFCSSLMPVSSVAVGGQHRRNRVENPGRDEGDASPSRRGLFARVK